MKPRSPLPWTRELDDVTGPVRRCRLIRSVGGPVVAHDVGIPEADYIVHAANAHPRLVDLLTVVADPSFLKLEAAQRFLVSARAKRSWPSWESCHPNEDHRPHRYSVGSPGGQPWGSSFPPTTP
jgi:hypothetical protein